MNWEDRYKINPFELTIDTIKGQCHYMEKEDIYEWIYSDEKEITRLNNIIDKAIETLEDRIEYSEGCIYVEIPEEKYILEQGEILNILKEGK